MQPVQNPLHAQRWRKTYCLRTRTSGRGYATMLLLTILVACVPETDCKPRNLSPLILSDLATPRNGSPRSRPPKLRLLYYLLSLSTPLFSPWQSLWVLCTAFKRVRTQVVVVVVVVRELLFLVTSVICMRIRGRGQRLPQLLTTFV